MSLISALASIFKGDQSLDNSRKEALVKIEQMESSNQKIIDLEDEIRTILGRYIPNLDYAKLDSLTLTSWDYEKVAALMDVIDSIRTSVFHMKSPKHSGPRVITYVNYHGTFQIKKGS